MRHEFVCFLKMPKLLFSIKLLHEWGTPTLAKPCIGQIHVQHIEKRIQGHFQCMKLTKINGTMGTHTLENASKAQPTIILKYILRD
jgi:hypothetical protein